MGVPRGIVIASLVAAAASGVASAQCRDETDPFWARLTVTRARAIDDPEGCCGGAPELFVRVFVNGVQTCQLGPWGSSFSFEGTAQCDFAIAPPYAPVHLRLQLWDDDDGLGIADDQLDISPVAGVTLDFDYDPLCNSVTDGADAGEVLGCPPGSKTAYCKGNEHRVEGNGDAGDGRGSISFSVGPRDDETPLNDDLMVTGLEIIQVTPNPDAIVHDRATMVRARILNGYDHDLVVPVEALALDELSNLFHDERTVSVAACNGATVELYAPDWNPPGTTWGFRPQAGPGSPPGHLQVLVLADPQHVIEPCPTDCFDDCSISNNAQGNDRLPVKPMRDLAVLLQPVAETDDCWPDEPAGDGADAAASAAAAVDYMRDLIPAQNLTLDSTEEVLTLYDDDIVNIPHVSLAETELTGVLAEGYDRVVGIVKDRYFACHYWGEWADAIGASLGEYGPRLSLAESPAAAVNSEVVTHEMSHTFGISEAVCPLSFPDDVFGCEDEYNWCGVGDPLCPTRDGMDVRGFNLRTGVAIDPATVSCLMGSSEKDDGMSPDDWLCDVDYNQLLSRFKLEADPEVIWLHMRFGVGLVGSFDKSDAARLPAGFPDLLSEGGGGPPGPGKDTTSVVFKDGGGSVLDRVHFTPENVDADGDGREESFAAPEERSAHATRDVAVVLALPAGTTRLELLRRSCVGGVGDECDGGVVQEAMTDAYDLPAEQVAIELLSPPSSVLVHPGDVIPIRWRDLFPGRAPEALSRLSYVLVSPDNGTHWIPLAARVAGDGYDWRAHGSGRYLTRVFTTNGFNTDDARGQSDLDGDGCGDSVDPSPGVPDADSDGDGIADVCDDCVSSPDPAQQNDDGDTWGNACDNCPVTANDPQSDGDGDAHGDACDCAPTASTTWEIPAAASGLRLNRPATGGATAVALAWTSLAVQAGSSTRYDLLTGYLGSLLAGGSFSTAACFANDVTATGLTSAQAWPPPSAQRGYWYLVRGQNSCGAGSWGDSSLVPDPRDPLDGTPGVCP